jgi:hypothetical protein
LSIGKDASVVPIKGTLNKLRYFFKNFLLSRSGLENLVEGKVELFVSFGSSYP